MKYIHRKQKGLSDIKRTVKAVKDSYVIVDRWSNQIVFVGPANASDISFYMNHSETYMYYQTER